MIRAVAARALTVLIAGGCLVGCVALPVKLVYLDTASAVFASYADRYNAVQNHYRLITRYVADPAERLARGESDADVLIGPWLVNTKIRDRLRPLGQLFRSETIDASSFYPNLLLAGQVEGVQTALPLSFRLSAVVMRASDVADHPFSVDLTKLAALSMVSHGWDVELVYQAAVLHGAELRLLSNGDISLDQEAVDRAVELARELLGKASAVAGRPAADDERTLPPERLLLNGDIDFFLSDPQGFLNIPEQQRRLLVLSWLGSGGRLQADDDLTYAAIRSGARNLRGAQSFLLWLFEPATQTSLLDLNRDQRLSTFGIAGGLPALIEVTERELASRYPFMLGLEPTPVELEAPPALIADWGRLRYEVVMPWLQAALEGAEQPPLAEAINSKRIRFVNPR